MALNITTEDKERQRGKIEEKDGRQARKKVEDSHRKRDTKNKITRYDQNMMRDSTRYDACQDNKIEQDMMRVLDQKIVYFIMIIDCKVLTAAHKFTANN